jgi:hypothetical protein
MHNPIYKPLKFNVMSTKKTLSETESLEKYRVSFENVRNQSEIAAVMAEFGYDEATIAQGEALLTETRQVFDANKTEDDETSAASNDFKEKKRLLEHTYSRQRKLAKVVFINDPVTADRLAITGVIPVAYVNWLETARKLYTVALADTGIQSKLSRLGITTDDLNAATTHISDLEAARTLYLKEVGESQQATKTKDAAFARIDSWMRDFYAVARIALEDKPQLLEALGVFVRS